VFNSRRRIGSYKLKRYLGVTAFRPREIGDYFRNDRSIEILNCFMVKWPVPKDPEFDELLGDLYRNLTHLRRNLPQESALNAQQRSPS